MVAERKELKSKLESLSNEKLVSQYVLAKQTLSTHPVIELLNDRLSKARFDEAKIAGDIKQAEAERPAQIYKYLENGVPRNTLVGFSVSCLLDEIGLDSDSMKTLIAKLSVDDKSRLYKEFESYCHSVDDFIDIDREINYREAELEALKLEAEFNLEETENKSVFTLKQIQAGKKLRQFIALDDTRDQSEGTKPSENFEALKNEFLVKEIKVRPEFKKIFEYFREKILSSGSSRELKSIRQEFRKDPLSKGLGFSLFSKRSNEFKQLNLFSEKMMRVHGGKNIKLSEELKIRIEKEVKGSENPMFRQYDKRAEESEKLSQRSSATL
jgi:hypothetical protein